MNYFKKRNAPIHSKAEHCVSVSNCGGYQHFSCGYQHILVDISISTE